MEWLNYKGVEMSEMNGVGKKNGRNGKELKELNYLVWIKKEKRKREGMLINTFIITLLLFPSF